MDVFVQLVGSDASVTALQSRFIAWSASDELGSITRRRTAIVSPDQRRHLAAWADQGWTFVEATSIAASLSVALTEAGRAGVPLLILLGPIDVSGDAIGLLHECLDRDPMAGFAVPRVACADRCCFARLTRFGVGPGGWVPRAVLAEVPEREWLAEMAAPCVLVSAQVTGNFQAVDPEFEGLAAALIHYLAVARRCGFRTVISNRAVVGIDGLSCATAVAHVVPALSAWDRGRLRQLVPDGDRSWGEFRGHSLEQFERLSTARFRSEKASRPSLLLDLRNLGPIFNGTSYAVLGLVQGLKTLQPPWTIELLAHPPAAAFHGLKDAFPAWPVHRAIPDRPFTVALRPSQPWRLQEMIDLHGAALVNAYVVLDTIAWDVVYCSPPYLDGTWSFLADHADALLFDSEFSHQRFLQRFPAARATTTAVTHLSFEPSEYATSGRASVAGDYVLVVGNGLDHKDIGPTVESLSAAFPYRRICAIGLRVAVSPRITALKSGDLPERDMRRLYANADVVVFPSFYEGFGFPILMALAYGRTVVARRSTLLDEVAARCAPQGRLVTFDTREELVDLMGRLLHGAPVPEQPLGLALNGGRPKSWRDVAASTIACLERVASDPTSGRWAARDHVIRQLNAHTS